ncbi:MAG TPA: CHRD domain-containing protein [Thermoanaerobaculia bacterium]|nr:CHRD domain-containing protein [Thermoanaerobaculia bacterium]
MRNPSRRSIWLSIVLCLLAAGAARAQTFTYVAALTGANETPNPADPDGVGFAVINIDQGAGSITFTAYAQNIASISASHIHRGAAGVTGPVIIPFNQPFTNGVSSGTLPGIAPALLAEIIANPPGYYFNVHTTDFPGGAIRGQLQPAPGTAAPVVLYLPVTVKANGARGENFVEDVRIVSRAQAAANVTIDFFASNASGLAAPTATKVVAVAVNQELVLNDILGNTFNTSGIGALRFTTDRDVIVEGRILDDRRANNQGQLGFFVHGLGIEAPCRFGTLPVLSQASAAQITAGIGLRSNIGYFNPNLLAVSATFTARKASDGSSLGSVTVTIPGLSHAQFPVFSLINTVAAGDQAQDDFYVSYTVAAAPGVNLSGGPLFVYLAVGDNFTGDSYYSAGVCGR